jgi:hypothetical protein
MRRASHGRVHQKNIQPFDAAHCVQCTVRVSIEGIRERLAHRCAAVVIARDCGERHLQRAKKLCCMRVLFRLRGIGNVAGNHHEVRTRRQAVQRADGPQKRRRSVDATVGQRARRRNVRSEIWAIKIVREAKVGLRRDRTARSYATGE